VSFDDLPEARLLGISSVRTPVEDLGRAAARLALGLLAGERAPIQTRVAGRVMARASTRGAGGPRGPAKNGRGSRAGDSR